jgi:hypothetical protein
MSKIHKACLLLNVDYTPVTIIDWKKSICWYIKTQEQKYPSIDILAYHNEYIIGLNNPKIKVDEKYSECCVCLCNTTTKSKCKHTICIPCADKIQEYYCEKCDEDRGVEYYCDTEGCGMKRCPICRETLFINKYYVR